MVVGEVEHLVGAIGAQPVREAVAGPEQCGVLVQGDGDELVDHVLGGLLRLPHEPLQLLGPSCLRDEATLAAQALGPCHAEAQPQVLHAPLPRPAAGVDRVDRPPSPAEGDRFVALDPAALLGVEADGVQVRGGADLGRAPRVQRVALGLQRTSLHHARRHTDGRGRRSRSSQSTRSHSYGASVPPSLRERPARRTDGHHVSLIGSRCLPVGLADMPIHTLPANVDL